MKTFTKKTLGLFLVISFCTGCNLIKAFKHLNKEEETFNNEKAKFDYINNQILIKTNFSNRISLNFILDLGAASNTIFQDSNYYDLIRNQKPILGIGKVVSADGIKSRKAYYQFGNLTTNWFSINDSFLSTTYRPHVDLCNKIYGLWGASIFCLTQNGKGNKILHIRMQDSTLTILDTLPLLNDWILVETTKMKIFHLFKIKMYIGKDAFDFLFDTGFNGSVLLSSNAMEQIERSSEIPLKEDIRYGYLSNTLSGVKPDSMIIIRNNVSLNNDLKADSVVILSSNRINWNLIGMDFIRRFNVLVDYQHSNIYFQPNPNFRPQKDTFFRIKGFIPKNSMDKGFCIMNMIVNSSAERAGLKIGDEIISINDIHIDEGDRCEIEKIYNNLDSKKTDNQVIVKRGTEILRFVL